MIPSKKQKKNMYWPLTMELKTHVFHFFTTATFSTVLNTSLAEETLRKENLSGFLHVSGKRTGSVQCPQLLYLHLVKAELLERANSKPKHQYCAPVFTKHREG